MKYYNYPQKYYNNIYFSDIDKLYICLFKDNVEIYVSVTGYDVYKMSSLKERTLKIYETIDVKNFLQTHSINQLNKFIEMKLKLYTMTTDFEN